MSAFAFDHVVLAVPDLARGSEHFADTTGCRPVDGGPHPAMGTRNALASFSHGRYLELIGPDPGRDGDRNLGGRLAQLSSDRLLGWAMRARELAEWNATAARHGFDTTGVLSIDRVRPDGARLEWEMVGLRGLGGAWPFFIDWKDAPHPSLDSPVVGALLDFEARLPADDAKALPFAPAEGARFVEGMPRISLAFETARGVVEWSRDDPGGLFD